MPASTPLGIIYPCAGDTISAAAFQTYAETVQDAIENVQENYTETAQFPDALQARRVVQQTFNAGVSTGLGWDTVAYNPFPASINYTVPSGTVTLQRAGSYLIGAHLRIGSQPANMTSMRIAILLNGVEASYFKADSGATSGTVNIEVATNVLAAAITTPTTVTVNALYTGAASPVGVTSLISIIRVAGA